jgi:hypothetical protein
MIHRCRKLYAAQPRQLKSKDSQHEQRPMPNSAIDHQFHLALRDQEKAEKFAEHIAELATEIINASLKFSQATKSAYESELIPKRRGADKNFDEADQAKLALGAFSFFMHLLDRCFLDMKTKIMRDAVFDFIFANLPNHLCAKFTTAPAQIQELVLKHYDRRTGQLAEAPIVLGEGLEDKNSAAWCAAQAICDEDLARDDRRLVMIVETQLRQCLETLSFAEHVTAMAELVWLPSHNSTNRLAVRAASDRRGAIGFIGRS